jgi:hypothetical protein
LDVRTLFRRVSLLPSLKNGIAPKGDQYSHLCKIPS